MRMEKWKKAQNAKFRKENREIEVMLYGDDAIKEREARGREARSQLAGNAPDPNADFFMSTGGGTPIPKGGKMKAGTVISADKQKRENARKSGNDARTEQAHDAETGQFLSNADVEMEREFPDRAKNNPKYTRNIVFQKTEYGDPNGKRTLNVDLTVDELLTMSRTYGEELQSIDSIASLRIVGKYHKNGQKKSDSQLKKEKDAATAKGARKFWEGEKTDRDFDRRSRVAVGNFATPKKNNTTPTQPVNKNNAVPTQPTKPNNTNNASGGGSFTYGGKTYSAQHMTNKLNAVNKELQSRNEKPINMGRLKQLIHAKKIPMN